MVDNERTQPVHIIISKHETTLRSLLKDNELLDLVKKGNTIVLSEGKSLTNLDMVISSGKKLAVISFEVLGGG
jgi:uncharacterized Zn finger protein